MIHSRRRAFTLIELLVVVAIIALLISILLPGLKAARESARAAVCGTGLRGFGTGLATYVAEHKDYVPGINTSGGTLQLSILNSPDPTVPLRNLRLPVQTWDWMSPLISTSTELGPNRAERFLKLINDYRCPSQAIVKADYLYPPGLPAAQVRDRADFLPREKDFQSVSYLMPGSFQYFGTRSNVSLGVDRFGQRVGAAVVPTGFNWSIERYQGKLDQVGRAASKIFAADGMRYLTNTDQIDFDVSPTSTFYGAFGSAGAFWCGDESYGVRQQSANWDGRQVSAGGSNPESAGRALSFTYRHGSSVSSDIATDARSNRGTINAVFFDGHVARMGDRQSRAVEHWYPSGAILEDQAQNMFNHENNFRVP